MSLLLLFHGVKTQIDQGGGLHFGRHVSLPKQAVIDARIKAEQFEALQSVIQAKQGPVNLPVSVPVVPEPPVKVVQGITARIDAAQVDTTQADALMARLLERVAAKTAASGKQEESEMTDADAYMLMTLALEVMT